MTAGYFEVPARAKPDLPGGWTDGDGERLFEERLVPVCSHDALARFRSSGLEHATLLHVETDDDGWPGWETYFDALGLARGNNAGRTFSNYVQATQAAIVGLGVMLGWISNTGDLVKEGRLCVFNDRPLIPDGAFYLLNDRQTSVKPAAALLASHLRQSAAQI